MEKCYPTVDTKGYKKRHPLFVRQGKRQALFLKGNSTRRTTALYWIQILIKKILIVLISFLFNATTTEKLISTKKHKFIYIFYVKLDLTTARYKVV